MDDLREHFDRAVSAEPGVDPAAMAHAAIAAGGRLRRRRQMTVAGAAAAMVLAGGVAAGVSLRPDAPEPHGPAVIAAAMMPLAAPGCSADGVPSGATDAALFLATATSATQEAAIRSALDGDPRVASSVFESNQTAYERFKVMWADSPEFVAAVSPSSLPASFRVRLTEASQYEAFERQYAAMDGVQDIVGRICSTGAPIGGVR